MSLMDIFRKSPQERDVELLGLQMLRLVEAARAKNATKLAADLSKSYARLYSKGSAAVRSRLVDFTKNTLSDILLKLRQPQMGEISPGVKMETQNTCALAHMLLFTFLASCREQGQFPEIEDLYQRELQAQTTPPSARVQPREVVVDFAKVMEDHKKDRTK
ncbi:hypothetical protein ACFLQU_03555 [Verrucomicrobiota bacterium]